MRALLFLTVLSHPLLWIFMTTRVRLLFLVFHGLSCYIHDFGYSWPLMSDPPFRIFVTTRVRSSDSNIQDHSCHISCFEYSYHNPYFEYLIPLMSYPLFWIFMTTCVISSISNNMNTPYISVVQARCVSLRLQSLGHAEIICLNINIWLVKDIKNYTSLQVYPLGCNFMRL